VHLSIDILRTPCLQDRSSKEWTIPSARPKRSKKVDKSKVQESDISTCKEDANTNVNAITLLQLKTEEILEEEEIDVLAEEKESANFDVAEFKLLEEWMGLVLEVEDAGFIEDVPHDYAFSSLDVYNDDMDKIEDV
ncbi:hypothetical protein L7F22_048670, partial [Adiantum nelumboides]|nr:hypothetical protein [Adiantum nelumboides]